MTIEAYNKATKILEEKKQLEERLKHIKGAYSFDFTDVEEYIQICEKLFILGSEFAAL